MATIHVTKKLFSKMRSLEAAVEQAAPGDTIVLSAGTFKGLINITKPLTIIGQIGETTIEGRLKIEADVTIENITFRNHYKEEGNYALYIHKGTTTLSKCLIFKIDGTGVAIDNGASVIADRITVTRSKSAITVQDQSSLKITDSYLQDNNSNAIIVYTGSRAEISGCLLEQHTYPALFVRGESSVQVTDCRFMNNDYHGVDIEQSAAIFECCTFSNNKKVNIHICMQSDVQLLNCEIEQSGEFGYGIYCEHSKLRIDGCKIHDHANPQIYTNETELTVHATDIFNGVKTNGLRITNNSTLTLTKSNIHSHGLIQVSMESGSELNMQHTNIFDGESTGIEFEQSTGNIEHSRLYNNVGQINATGSSSLTISNSSLYDSKEGGYGCYITKNGQLKMTECDVYNHVEFLVYGDNSDMYIAHCKLHDSLGNGIRLTDKGTATVEHCELYNNNTIQMSIEPTTEATIRHCRLSNGSNNGIEIEGATVVVEHCELFDNGLAQVHISEQAKVTVNDCHIHDGKEETYGIYVVTGSDVKINDCHIHHHASVQIYIDESTAEVYRTTVHDGQDTGLRFVDKSKGLVDGCDVYEHADNVQVSTIMNSDAVILNSTIHDNEGYGILFDSSKGAVEHCHLYGNSNRQMSICNESDVYVFSTQVDQPKPESNGIVVTTSANAEIIECTVMHHDYPQLFIDEKATFHIAKTKVFDGNNGSGLRIIDAKGLIEHSESARNGDFPQMTIEDGAEVTVLHSRIHSGEGVGLSVSNAYIQMEHCQLYGSESSQLDLIDGCTGDIRHCQLYDGSSHGIRVTNESTPTISHVDVYGHTGRYAQVVIKEQANPTFKHCKIYDGFGDGVLIYMEGYGTIEDCYVYEHGDSNIVIAQASRPILCRNTVQGARYGIFAEEASPTIENCTFNDHYLDDLYIDEASAPILVGNVYKTYTRDITPQSEAPDYEAILGFDPSTLDAEELQARLATENRKWLNRLNAPSEKKRLQAEQAIALIATLREQS